MLDHQNFHMFWLYAHMKINVIPDSSSSENLNSVTIASDLAENTKMKGVNASESL